MSGFVSVYYHHIKFATYVFYVMGCGMFKSSNFCIKLHFEFSSNFNIELVAAACVYVWMFCATQFNIQYFNLWRKSFFPVMDFWRILNVITFYFRNTDYNYYYKIFCPRTPFFLMNIYILKICKASEIMWKCSI